MGLTLMSTHKQRCLLFCQGLTLAVVDFPNTTGLSVLAGEIPSVTSHIGY